MLAGSKRIVVLSDSDGLARALELNLQDYAEIEVVRPERPASCEMGQCSLIIVAASAESSEPVVALARALLLDRVGRVPVLIISDRPFQTDPECQISHLDFPFTIASLHDRVGEMLHGAA